jgi:hypothetical protein
LCLELWLWQDAVKAGNIDIIDVDAQPSTPPEQKVRSPQQQSVPAGAARPAHVPTFHRDWSDSGTELI